MSSGEEFRRRRGKLEAQVQWSSFETAYKRRLKSCKMDVMAGEASLKWGEQRVRLKPQELQKLVNDIRWAHTPETGKYDWVKLINCSVVAVQVRWLIQAILQLTKKDFQWRLYIISKNSGWIYKGFFFHQQLLNTTKTANSQLAVVFTYTEPPEE